MDVAEVLPLHLKLELPEGLNKGHALNVSNRSAQLLAHNARLKSRNRYHPHISAAELTLEVP